MKRHIRILDGFNLAFPDAVPNTDIQVSWQQLGLEGKWNGHWQGAFSLNRATFEQMVQHFEASPGHDVVVDYEHSSVFGDKAPASGWVKALQLRDGNGGQAELWGQIEWTPNAAAHITAREYRYLSPTFVWNTRDRKSGAMTGASLHSVALTNTPFLHELPEVRLNSLRAALQSHAPKESDEMTEEQLQALRKLLGLSDDATAELILEAAGNTAAAASLGAEVIGQLNLGDGAGRDQVMAAVVALRNPAMDPKEVAALRQRVAEMEAREATRNASELVAQALSEGKLTAPGTEQHKWAQGFAQTYPQAFGEWLKSAPKVVPLTQQVPSNQQTGALSDLERETMDLVGLDPETFKKYDRPAR